MEPENRLIISRFFGCYNFISTLTKFTDEKGKGCFSVKKKSTDCHHLLWCKKDYSKGLAKRLRSHWYLRTEIPQDTLHRQIHCKITRIPVPKGANIKSALYQLQALEMYGAIHEEDRIERRLMILCALFECAEPETYEALKRQYDIVYEFYNKKAPK